jgi:hypothetical protein
MMDEDNFTFILRTIRNAQVQCVGKVEKSKCSYHTVLGRVKTRQALKNSLQPKAVTV